MRKQPFNFKGKTVVITGASRGIGAAAASCFVASGAKVVGISKTERGKISSRRYSHFNVDVSDIGSFQNWILNFTKKRKIDIFVNNAGVYPSSKLYDVTEHSWDQSFSVNLKGAFFAAQAVAKTMKDGGVIVNASSFAASMPSLGSGVYAAGKAAIEILTKTMAAEWGKRNIRVNAYAPGVIETDMTKDGRKNKKNTLLRPIALARFGTPEEVAASILFLCSDEASYVTGAVLAIDGGKYIVQNQEEA
ncbi:MAG: SDR family NAD(P)-dependent oxidoreductase [bacterium]|nr:SDR family NAD(P)-dependent oxidoreductase [bacterium]